MFERTVSFWRRLLGSQPTAAEKSDGKADERRVFVRYPTNFQTTYQLAGTTATSSGRVRNVSIGGMNMLAEKQHKPGDMLSVDLPGTEPNTTVNILACVVHARPEGDKSWSLGCTFARELTADDLAPFGARVGAGGPEQRAKERYSCDVTANYQVVTAPFPESMSAQVLNISSTGIKLLSTQALQNGTLISIDMAPAKGDGLPVTILSCVVHVAEQESGQWLLGCNFITELSEEDLKKLL